MSQVGVDRECDFHQYTLMRDVFHTGHGRRERNGRHGSDQVPPVLALLRRTHVVKDWTFHERHFGGYDLRRFAR